MRRTTFAAAICIAALVAGCGSSKTVTKPAPGAGVNTGPASTGSGTSGSTTGGPVSGTNVTGMQPGSTGTMGPPPGGGQYDLHNGTVLKHLL